MGRTRTSPPSAPSRASWTRRQAGLPGHAAKPSFLDRARADPDEPAVRKDEPARTPAGQPGSPRRPTTRSGRRSAAAPRPTTPTPTRCCRLPGKARAARGPDGGEPPVAAAAPSGRGPSAASVPEEAQEDRPSRTPGRSRSSDGPRALRPVAGRRDAAARRDPEATSGRAAAHLRGAPAALRRAAPPVRGAAPRRDLPACLRRAAAPPRNASAAFAGPSASAKRPQRAFDRAEASRRSASGCLR